MKDNHNAKFQLALEEGVTSKTPSKIPLLLAGIFVVTTVALLVTTIVFGLQRNNIASELDKLKAKPQESGWICTTKQCYESAYTYLSNMDQSKNPCDNFFEYACGGWIKSHVIPEDETSYSVLIKIRDSVIDKLKALFEGSPTTGEPDPYHVVRNYYKSCEDMDTINELGAEPLTDLLTSLGGWPVLGDNPAGGNWDPAAFDFEKLWADIRGKYDVQMFVATEVSPVRNKPKYTLTAQIPDFGVPYDEIEEKKRPGIKTLFKESHDTRYRGAEILLEEKYSKMKEAYRQYAIDIALALGASEAVATQDINDLIEFETTLANVFHYPLK